MTPSTSALPTDGLSTSAKNDEAIMQALAKLENPIERKKLKLTVDAICELTGLSTNTVRSREWALVKLNEMKQHAKSKRNPIESSSENGVFLDEVSTMDALRDRIRKLLNQNALLFEEIMFLRAQIKKRDESLSAIQGKRLTVL